MSAIGIFQRLRDEHEHVLAELDLLERAARSPVDSAGGLEELRGLVDRLESGFTVHARAEDEVLFPALVDALVEVRASVSPLQDEHNELRSMLVALAGVLAEPPGRERDEQIAVQSRDFVDLLRIHVRKEEALVFRVAERVLPDGALEKLAERMRIHHPNLAAERSRNPREGQTP